MMCTSTQSRSHLSPTQMSIFVFDLYPGNIKPWSRSRDLHLTSKEAPSHLRPGRRIRVSAPTRCHLTPFQVWKFASKLHLCSVPPPSTSRSHLISIPAQIFASHIHPGDVYRSCASHIHPGPVSPASKFQYPYLTSTHVTSHFHPGPKFRVSFASMWISPPAYSLPFKSWYLHHSSIHILSHTNPHFNVSTWTPSRSRLTSIQVPWLAFHIHPSRPSTLSCCISIPARSHLNPIQFSGWASHLHPCPGSPPFIFL